MTFQDEIHRMLAEGLRDANERLTPGTPDLVVDPELLLQDKPTITVNRATGYVQVSTEQMLDAGIITEEQAREQGWTPYVAPPIPWYRRARWHWQAWRERAGRKVGGWIAGMDLTERDEDW